MKRTITITTDDAKKLYNDPATSDAVKLMLQSSFTADELKVKSLPDKYEDLKVRNGFKKSSTTIYLNKRFAESAIALAKLGYLVEAYNEGWVKSEIVNEEFYEIGYESCNNDLLTDHIFIRKSNGCYSPLLSFKTEEVALKFECKFRDLIKQYFMV